MIALSVYLTFSARETTLVLVALAYILREFN